MTAQAEYDLLAEQYALWIAAGMPTSYMINGRAKTTSDWDWIVKRLDQLQLAINRASAAGSCPVASFRPQD